MSRTKWYAGNWFASKWHAAKWWGTATLAEKAGGYDELHGRDILELEEEEEILTVITGFMNNVIARLY